MNTAAKIETQVVDSKSLPVPGNFMPEQGGFFVGIVLVDGARFGFVVAPKAQGETKGEWGAYGEKIDARRVGNGPANTATMIAAGSPIAKWTTDLAVNGFQDWYVPSRDELELCYRNLKPADKENYCWFRDGENPSSVPQGCLYEPTIPAQTTIPEFMTGGSEAFEADLYWSSTQYSAHDAVVQAFGDGSQDDDTKGNVWRVRAVRRFLID